MEVLKISIILPAHQIPIAQHFFCLRLESAAYKEKTEAVGFTHKGNPELLELERQIQLFTKRSGGTRYFCWRQAIIVCFEQTC